MRVNYLTGTLIALALLAGTPRADADERSGVLRVLVFAGPLRVPVPGAAVTAQAVEDGEAADETATASGLTNRDGAARFQQSPGVWALTVALPGKRAVPVGAALVVAGQVTEVLVTAHADGRPAEVRIEAATEAATDGASDTPTGPVGPLRGVVVHAESGRPIRGARVFVRGQPVEGRSEGDGTFRLTLPVGAHDVTVVHPEFATESLRGLPVTEAEGAPVTVELTPAAVSLAVFDVTAPRIEGSAVELLQERRAAGGVSDVIGAEAMARAGDSDAAGALKRVTGVTVVGGKYVYVRGLGERYSSTLLNGSTLPSPEPERRVVPLDLFPTSVLESVVIQKTYSADLPGEFGGGAVQLRTRGYPTQLLVELGVSMGGTIGKTFGSGLMPDSGPTDWLGVDSGFRGLPGDLAAASASSPIAESDMFSDRGYDAAELERLGELLSNRWSPGRGTLPPDAGFDALVGQRFELWGAEAGFLASLTYDNSWSATESHADYFLLGEGGSLERGHSYDFTTVENTVVLATMLELGLDLSENHRFRLTTLVDRITTNEARTYQGPNRDVGTEIRVTRLRWLERMLVTQQARGDHRLPALGDLAIAWRYTFSLAQRHEPDRREVRRDREGDTDVWLLSDRPEGNQRVFSDLEDTNHDVGLDFTLPFAHWDAREERPVALKFGFAANQKDREVDTRRYKFLHKGPRSGDPDILSQAPEDIFAPGNIGADGFQLGEITRQTDNYTAGQTVLAGYAQVDLPIGAGWRVVGGVRAEWSRQDVTTFELFNPAFVPVVAELSQLDWLPAAAVTWEFHEAMLLRLGYGRTVSRPDFRELSPATFNDVTGGRQVFGNPDLERATLHNVDLRWEWYLGPRESLSVGGFYKRFERPIESVVVVSAQHSVTYENADGADNVGVELEFTKRFGWLHPALDDLFLAGNATWVYSRIVLPEGSGIQTSGSRPLQGQSPYVVNLQLGWDDADRGTTVTLLYHVFGRRITEVGALGAPDIYEEPVHQLDLVYRQALGAGFSLKLKLANLLDMTVRRTQGPETTERYRRGRRVSLGVSWAW